MSTVLDWPLTTGPAPNVLVGVGVLASAYLMTRRRDRSGVLRCVIAAVSGAAILTGSVATVLALAHPFPDPIPSVVWVSLAACGAACGAAVRVIAVMGRRAVLGAAAATLLVVVSAGAQVNGYFDQYPTVGSLLAVTSNEVALTSVPAREAVVAAAPGRSLAELWRPPPDLPAHGVVSQADIAGVVSGFRARPAWVYLPPAYLVSPRAQLPVLVLLAGQPGSPQDWLRGGQLGPLMDAFAAAHHGLAPIVVVPDWTGTLTANPLCMDSRLGRVQTYLSVDVPSWVAGHLQADVSPAGRAVAGLSAGGTCALQLATNRPDVYPTFVSVSGQSAPTLGDPVGTVQAAFGGDAAAFRAVAPLDLLARHRYPRSAGFVVVGTGDAVYRPEARDVARAAQGRLSGVVYREVPGRHDWGTWRLGLQEALPWLGARLHLTSDVAPALSSLR